MNAGQTSVDMDIWMDIDMDGNFISIASLTQSKSKKNSENKSIFHAVFQTSNG